MPEADPPAMPPPVQSPVPDAQALQPQSAEADAAIIIMKAEAHMVLKIRFTVVILRCRKLKVFGELRCKDLLASLIRPSPACFPAAAVRCDETRSAKTARVGVPLERVPDGLIKRRSPRDRVRRIRTNPRGVQNTRR